jgi:hypothetical protein
MFRVIEVTEVQALLEVLQLLRCRRPLKGVSLALSYLNEYQQEGR